MWRSADGTENSNFGELFSELFSVIFFRNILFKVYLFKAYKLAGSFKKASDRVHILVTSRKIRNTARSTTIADGVYAKLSTFNSAEKRKFALTL